MARPVSFVRSIENLIFVVSIHFSKKKKLETVVFLTVAGHGREVSKKEGKKRKKEGTGRCGGTVVTISETPGGGTGNTVTAP